MSLHVVDSSGNLVSNSQLTQFLSSTLSGDTKVNSRRECEALLGSVGVNYHVIGVFGGQSSGKSTLLNHLFATDFQTLDETVRRGQTTKGAFLAKADTSLEGFSQADPREAGGEPVGELHKEASNRLRASAAEKGSAPQHASPVMSPLLIFDFEGTDGLERGEDQSFERQLSLFGLSVADTLIINMWAVDVGRFNAANLSLLRTMFEVNLQLFSHESYKKDEKPTLLIVLRDFTEDDPSPSLVTVRKSFDTIWESITRPDCFSKSPIDDLFNLKYYVMPHYKLQRAEFGQSVLQFRRWFGDGTCSDYLFRYRAMFRGVPLEALPAYLSSCWEAIRTSKDLDIPTQRQMLAGHRCTEVKEQELRTFQGLCRHYEDRIHRGEMLLRLTETLDEEMSTRLTAYFSQTRLYNKDVVSQTAIELEKALVDATMMVVGRFSKAITAEVLGGMEVRVQSMLDDCLLKTQKAAQNVPFVADGTTSGEATGHVIDNEACQGVVAAFWRGVCEGTSRFLAELSVNPPHAHLYGRYTTLVAQDTVARGNVMNMVTECIFAKVQSRLASMADDASEVMHRGFEQCITHNVDGTVRFFSTTTGLQKVVPNAQQTGLVLMGCLLYFRLRLAPNARSRSSKRAGEDGDAPRSRSARQVDRERRVILLRDNQEEQRFFMTYSTLDQMPAYPLDVSVKPPQMRANAASATSGAGAGEGEMGDDGDDHGEGGVTFECVMMSQQSAQRAYELYRQRCEFTTQLQLRSIEAGKQRLPAWVIPTIFILGFNELVFVLTSPILLLFIIVVAMVFFKNFIISKWQAFEETAPSPIVIPAQAVVAHAKSVYKLLVPDSDNGRSPSSRVQGAAEPSPAPGQRAAPPASIHADPAPSGASHADQVRQRLPRRKE